MQVSCCGDRARSVRDPFANGRGPYRPDQAKNRKVASIIKLTTSSKPANATHWSTRSIAERAGVSEATVRRIWCAHGLKPHLSRTFKVSNDPEFAEKLADVVGL